MNQLFRCPLFFETFKGCNPNLHRAQRRLTGAHSRKALRRCLIPARIRDYSCL
jgi:hypothetical protein